MDNMHTQNVKQYKHGRQSLHIALSIRMQIPWGTALAHAVHLEVNVATVANAGFQLPEACVTGIRHPFSEKRTYTLPPHSQSHDVRNLNIVIALAMLAGSELTSEGVTRTRKSFARTYWRTMAPASCLLQTWTLARLEAGLEHAVLVPAYQLPQSWTHSNCSCRRLHRRKWRCKSSRQFHTTGIRAGKQRKSDKL